MLREATSLPVYSIVTLFNYFHGSRQASSGGGGGGDDEDEALLLDTLPELPAPGRDVHNNLRPDAFKRVQRSCERALGGVRELIAETLHDPVEFNVRGANVVDVVWRRLRLIDRVLPMLKAQTETETVNEVPLAGLNIHITDLWKHYLPLACSIHARYEAFLAKRREAGEPREAFVVGLNAPPGCGKSTLVQLLRVLVKAAAESEGADSLRVVHVSSDDLYMTKADRDARGIASRLKVESIDESLADTVLWPLKRAAEGSEVTIPRFNKGEDDREPEDMWTQVEGRVDIILYEGWRVGIDHPLYAKFNSAIDCLICLEANVEAIRKWKLESSKRDAESAGKFFDEAKVNEAFNRDIVPFMKVYEEPLVNRADLVLRKAASHSILSLDHALIEKLESIADFRLHSSGRNELTIDSVEDALTTLGRRSAARWVFELLHRRGVVTTLSKDLFVSTLATAINSSSAANRSFYFRQTTNTRSSSSLDPGKGLQLHRAKSSAEPFSCASGVSDHKSTPDAVAEAAAQLAEHVSSLLGQPINGRKEGRKEGRESRYRCTGID